MSRPNNILRLALSVSFSIFFVGAVQAQLRIVNYNTAGVTNSSAMTTVLGAIKDESVNGFARPIDVLILEELSGSDITTMTTIMNGFGVGTYVAGTVGSTTGAGGVGMIYRAESVDVLGQTQVVNTSITGAARGVMRYHFRPDNYTSADSEFFIYGSHYKSADNTDDANRRNVEAAAIRANAVSLTNTRQGLGQITNFIHTGDFNIYRSTEPMWGTLTAGGVGQMFDPLDDPLLIGNWHDGAAFKSVHTQNPAGAGFVGGGMDDRFDWQVINGELMNGDGVAYIGPVSTAPEMSLYDHSYRAFGNNNSHTLNAHINTGDGNATVLNALGSASDHLPIVADFQLPAVMEVEAELIPPVFTLNQSYSFDVEVMNAATVLVSLGADELNYSMSVSGDLISPLITDMDQALGGSNLHPVFLDTSSPGLKSGFITVMSSSQAVEDGFIQIPVNFLVLGIPEPASLMLLAMALGILSIGRRSWVAS